MEKHNTIDLKGLLRLIQHTPDLNFISLANTPWHISAIEAALLWLQDQGVKPKGICLVQPHYLAGYVCGEDTYTNEFSQKFLFVPDKPGKKHLRPWMKKRYRMMHFAYLDKKKGQNEENFYQLGTYVNLEMGTYLHTTLRHRHVVQLLTDEGVGTYLGTLNIECPPPTFNFKSFIKKPDSLSAWQYFRLQEYIAKHHEVKNLRLFLQDADGSVRVNTEIAPYFKKAIENEAKKTYNGSEVPDLSDKILICTTAWIRDKVFEEEDFRVLKSVCDDLHQRGYKLLLKPHPRDNFFASRAAELHAELLRTPYSMEVLCAINPPKAIVCYSSTALVTAKLFWDIPAYCLCKMLDQSKLGVLYQKESENFSHVFKRYLILPQTSGEINP